MTSTSPVAGTPSATLMSADTSSAPVFADPRVAPEGYERRVVDLWADDNNKKESYKADVQYVLVRLPELDNFISVGFENENYRIFRQNLLEFRRIRDSRPVMVVYQPPTTTTSEPSTSSSSNHSSTVPTPVSERGAPYAIYRGRWHTKATPFTDQTNLVVAQTFEGISGKNTGKEASNGTMKVGSKRGREEGEEDNKTVSEDHRTLTAGYPISAIMTLDRVPL